MSKHILLIDQVSDIARNTHFRFLDLPGEVRNNVYDICLGTAAAPKIIIRRGRNDPFSNSTSITLSIAAASNVSKWFSPRLLLVNRQLHRETHEILYRGRTFMLQDAGVASQFTRDIGSNVSSLEYLHIDTTAFFSPFHEIHEYWDFFRNVVPATRLKDFRVVLPDHWIKYQKHELFVEKLLENSRVRCWIFSQWERTHDVEAVVNVFEANVEGPLVEGFKKVLRESVLEELGPDSDEEGVGDGTPAGGASDSDGDD